MDKYGTVYMLASGRHGTLYIGVTSALERRIGQHRDESFKGFTTEYDVKRLVWYETHTAIQPAIAREKQLKNWKRDWKIVLIEANNPEWRDIAVDFGYAPLPAGPSRPFRVLPD